MDKKKTINVPGITFTGGITVNGPMFDIHDNEHIHFHMNGKTQQEDGDFKYVDLVFFDDNRLKSMESQNKLRRVLQSVLPRMDVDSGRDWIAIYIAYHYYIGCQHILRKQTDFFKDIEMLLPGVLTQLNQEETGDKRYRVYTDKLRRECDNWFIVNECLPPLNEWTLSRYDYRVDGKRKTRIQQLVKEIYQGLKNEVP